MGATASDQTDRSFAYTILVSQELDEAALAGRSYRDILDAFFDGEARASEELAMWPFGWGTRMRRVAPVQVTGTLDLRADLSRLIGSPRFRIDHPAVYGGSILYFAHPVLARTPAAAGSAAPPAAAAKDRERFRQIVRESAEMAGRREQGLLFVGGWGWDYPRDLGAEQQVALMAAGFPFVDRRVP